jgi:hypothetical protein
VAGGIPDADEEHLVFGFRQTKGLFVPGPPVDGVVGMLKKVGAALVDEFVGVGRAVLGIAILHFATQKQQEDGVGEKKEKFGHLFFHKGRILDFRMID